MKATFHRVDASRLALRQRTGSAREMNSLWIRLLAALHRWSGRQLHRARLKRLLHLVEQELRRRATDPCRN